MEQFSNFDLDRAVEDDDDVPMFNSDIFYREFQQSQDFDQYQNR